MKILNEQKIINKLPEKLVNRQYRIMRTRRNKAIAYAGATFCIAAAEAIAHKGLMTTIMGAYSLIGIKAVEIAINTMRILKPQYLEILNRAKSINKTKQANM